MDHTLRIKNLSIALEALSHIVGQQAHFNNIENILNEEIRQYWRENVKEKQWPHKAPAKPNLTDPFADDTPL